MTFQRLVVTARKMRVNSHDELLFRFQMIDSSMRQGHLGHEGRETHTHSEIVSWMMTYKRSIFLKEGWNNMLFHQM